MRFALTSILLGILIVIGFVTGELHWNHDTARCIEPHTAFAGWHTLTTVGSVDIRWPSWERQCGLQLDTKTKQLIPVPDPSAP